MLQVLQLAGRGLQKPTIWQAFAKSSNTAGLNAAGSSCQRQLPNCSEQYKDDECCLACRDALQVVVVTVHLARCLVAGFCCLILQFIAGHDAGSPLQGCAQVLVCIGHHWDCLEGARLFLWLCLRKVPQLSTHHNIAILINGNDASSRRKSKALTVIAFHKHRAHLYARSPIDSACRGTSSIHHLSTKPCKTQESSPCKLLQRCQD